MFMNTPELLTIGQQVFDKCIADMQNNGQEIPDSDAQLVKMLEEYFSGIFVVMYRHLLCIASYSGLYGGGRS